MTHRSLKVGLYALLALPLYGCLDTTADRQIDQSIQGLYDGDLSEKGDYSLIASIHHGASLWRIKDGERLYNWNHAQEGFSQIMIVLHNEDFLHVTEF